ncbi:MAG: carboxypeptidase regulatory-like domain-containing protein, partial [Acidobacteria bacterium]|nr:carboxypeptidase regulatory-like domain-containing protein [Acidobacteriota bacterium]
MRRRWLPFALLFAVAAVPGPSARLRAGAQAPQQPARDTPAQAKDAPAVPAGRISGRVLAADNGRPVKRARVFASAAELPEGRGALTDDTGAFDLAELPAGRYMVTVSKAGFVSLSYGQRRPLQAGTPLQLADGQQLKNVDFQLPRGSVIAGHVSDQDGDPMPGATVRVMRYQYMQGDRRLTPAGTGQTDDRGQYRIWGLMPGDYYVTALA